MVCVDQLEQFANNFPAKRTVSFRLFRYFRLFRILLFALLIISPIFTSAEERVNINTASAEELASLPGIGPTLAARIVEHRSKHGPFKRTQDIIIVKGMSAKLYRHIARLIRI